jgi:membrane protein
MDLQSQEGRSSRAMAEATTAKPSSSWWGITKQAAADWSEDKSTKLAAALAFYTMLSIAPLLIITIKVVGKVFGDDAAKGQIRAYLASNVSDKAATAAEEMIRNANQPGAGVLATIVSVVVLISSASGVFGELQDSLNTIWEVKPRPNRGIWATIKDRFFSFSLVLGVAFLMLVSLIASTVLSGVANHLGGGESAFWKAVHFLVSLVAVTGLFALIFRYLPDVRTPWRPILVGAAATAALFTIGKFLLGWYLGRGSTTSVYGAAGSLVAMLLWVYYSAQILFFGAEFTQAYAKATGAPMTPLPKAVRITEEDRAQQGIASPERVGRKLAEQPAGGLARPPAFRPRPAPVVARDAGAKPYVMAGSAFVAGALAGVLGGIRARTANSRAAVAAKVDARVQAIESKLGRVSRLTGYLDRLSVSDRIDAVEDRLRSAGTTLRAQNAGKPRWRVRLGELVAGE